MEGFFTIKETESVKIRRNIEQCGACKLYKDCLSPKMEATGEGRKRILIIAEAPGEEEDRRNIQLVGRCGRLLRDILDDLNINLDKDCRKINAVNCRPVGNRSPSEKEIEYCRPMVLKEIKKNKPKVIISLGSRAIRSLFSHRISGAEINVTKVRGFVIPDSELGAYVAPTFHPSYLMRSQNKVVDLLFKNDIENALSYLEEDPPPADDLDDKIEIITSIRNARKRLQKLLSDRPNVLAIDYETSGLKPQRKGHRILSCAIAPGPDECFAFPVDQRLYPMLKRILTDPSIGKIAANLKFEDIWTKEIMGFEVKNWTWDTCLAAHVLDNRSGITSVKFQAFLNFGILDYNSHIKGFMKAPDKSEWGANGFNRLEDLPLEDLLIYNGKDSLIEYRLAMLQMRGNWK